MGGGTKGRRAHCVMRLTTLRQEAARRVEATGDAHEPSEDGAKAAAESSVEATGDANEPSEDGAKAAADLEELRNQSCRRRRRRRTSCARQRRIGRRSAAR